MKFSTLIVSLLALLLKGCASHSLPYERMTLDEVVTSVMELPHPYHSSATSEKLKPLYEKFPVGSARDDVAAYLRTTFQKHPYAVMITGMLRDREFGVMVFHFTKRISGGETFSREAENFMFHFDADGRLTEISRYGLVSWW